VKANDADLLRQLPEVPVPTPLDALVFERACEALETAPERPAPVDVPRTEALIYVAGLTAYLAVLARALQSVAQHAIRVLGG
jgi:hypothetical protein